VGALADGRLLIVNAHDNSPRRELLDAMGATMGKVFPSADRLSTEKGTRFFLRLRTYGG
jgi:hypothetical protein